MARSVRVFLFVLMLLGVSNRYSSAQVQTGAPQFGSSAGGPDVVNLANLNVEFTVPVINKPGRGSNFSHNLVYDSSVWQPAINNGTLSWVSTAGQWGWQGLQPAGVAYATYALSYSTGQCGQNLFYQMWSYSNFQFFDSFGVIHTFPAISGSYMSTPGVGSCPPSGPTPATQPVTQTDETGYTMYASMQANSPNVHMIDKNGKVQYVAAWTTPPTSGPTSTTDRNGNIVSQTNGVYTDTLNAAALSVIGSAPSNTNLSYIAPSGANASYVVSYRGYIVRTAFGCNGITEYNSGTTQIYLVDKITMPDTSFYQFSYEQTPGFSSDVTGRIASVILPTGGQITYTYTGGSGGHVTCADGSASGLTRRAAPDGTWTYTRTPETGAAYVTKVTDPQNNDTLIQFQRIYETQRDIYQGAAPSFSTFPIPESTLQTSSLLREIQSCYNSSITACTNTAITLPITQRTITTQLSGATSWASALTSQRMEKYNTIGSPTEEDDYDYGVGTVGALVKKTAITYASLTNITGFPQQITVTNGSGTVVSETKYNYGDAVTGTSGTPQHTTPPGSRGNALSVNLYTQGTTNLTQSTTYFDTGNARTTTDVNGATTTFNYSNSTDTCGNSFPTSVSEPLSLLKSMTWKCTGGVQLTSVDENNQTITTTWNDPNFWRPASVADPLSNATLFAYSASNPAWAVQSLTFNGNQSNAYTGTGFDGLGRQIIKTHQQSPSGTAWDQVTQSYDSNGRPWKTSVPCVNTGAWTCPTTAKTITYDALNRPLLTTDGGGGTSTYSYSQNDVLVAVGPQPTGENTKRRQLEYDALGRLTSVCEVTSGTGSGTCGQRTAQTGFWTKYTYDAVGNLTGVTQNAQSTGSQQTRTYAYDMTSRLTSETNPESGMKTYVYDTDSTMCGSGAYTSNGDLLKTTDAAGNCVMRFYDSLHRLTDVGNNTQSVSHCKRFRYDNSAGYPGSTKPTGLTNTLGRLIEAATDKCDNTGDAIITDEWFSYTPRGEISDKYQSSPNSAGYYHEILTYWASGATKQISGLPSLPTFTYGVDGEGRLKSVTASTGQNPLSSASYNAASQPTNVNLGSGDSDVFTYDTNTNRMTKYQFNIGAQTFTGIPTWNSNGSFASLSITDPFYAPDTQNCAYSHDDLARISSANCGSAFSQTFSYDAFGNLKKSGTFSFQPAYNSATNRYSSIPGTTVSYDSAGNLLSDGTNTFAWDAFGKAINVRGHAVTHDAFGNMVEADYPSEFFYSPDGAAYILFKGQTARQASYYLPGGAQAMYDEANGGLILYRHADYLGNVRANSTPSRTFSYTQAYAPFGEPYAQSSVNIGTFAGISNTFSLDLYDTPNREYSDMGRWASPDPAGLAAVDPTIPQSWNRYAYVLNNPLAARDPLGLDCVYLNDAGDGVESIDHMSDNGGCEGSGGYWANGWVANSGWVQTNPFSDNILIYSQFDNGGIGVSLASQTWTQGAFGLSDQASISLNSFQQWMPLTSSQQAIRAIHNTLANLPTVCGKAGIFGSAEIAGFGFFGQVDENGKVSGSSLIPVAPGITDNVQLTDSGPLLFLGEGAGILYEPDLNNYGKPAALGGYLGFSVPGTKTEAAIGAYVEKPSIAGAYSCPGS
jgi:RHS repeat-associated protein